MLKADYDYKGRRSRARPTHFVIKIASPFTTRRIACGLQEDNALIATAEKAHVTCKRCKRSPLFDLYRGRC